MNRILSSPVLAALVAGIFGLLAVWLGLRRYRTERWWERKAAAYAAIIEALHTIEDTYDERIQALKKSVTLPIERIEKLRVAERDAHAEIRKYANQEGFLITKKAAEQLDDLSSFLGTEKPTNDTVDKYYNDRAIAAMLAIDAVKREAKTDLKT